MACIGAGGSGYAIGLTQEYFREISKRHIFPLKIVYDENMQKEAITNVVNKTCELLYSSIPQMDLLTDEAKTIINEFCLFFIGQLSEYIIRFKNPHFKEEREWRFVVLLSPLSEFNNNMIHFRVSRGIPIPYIETKTSLSVDNTKACKIPICCIRGGPNLHPELTKKSIELLLHKYGYDESVKVSVSDIPIRF